MPNPDCEKALERLETLSNEIEAVGKIVPAHAGLTLQLADMVRAVARAKLTNNGKAADPAMIAREDKGLPQ